MGLIDNLRRNMQSGPKGVTQYHSIGENLASFAFSMCNDDVISKLLTRCNFSPSERIRFKFDLFIVNLAVATHAVNFVLFNPDKAEKIIEPMFSMIDSYIKKIIPGDIKIGDFIVNDDEWRILRDNFQIYDPNTETSSNTLLDLVLNYRIKIYSEALFQGFGRFIKEKNLGGPMPPLVKLFVKNFPKNEKHTREPYLYLCDILLSYHCSIMDYCKKIL